MRYKIQSQTGRLGEWETRFFAWVQMRGKNVIRTGEVSSSLGLSAAKERDLLRRLARRGWIVRLQRGLYLIPRTLPIGGNWNPPESVALPALFRELKGRYQITGPNAFNRYGFDEQIPNCVFAYNNRISGERRIGSTRYVFIRVTDERLGASESVKTPEGLSLTFSSRARALVDALDDWSRFNTLPRALDWIRAEIQKRPEIAEELVRIAIRHGNQSVLRRLGYVLEQERVSSKHLKRLEQAIRRSTSTVVLVPNKSRKGPIIKRWGIIDNERQFQSRETIFTSR